MIGIIIIDFIHFLYRYTTDVLAQLIPDPCRINSFAGTSDVTLIIIPYHTFNPVIIQISSL